MSETIDWSNRIENSRDALDASRHRVPPVASNPRRGRTTIDASQQAATTLHAFIAPVAPPPTITGTVTTGGSPLSGATVTLGGTQNGSMTTGANGSYSFTVSAGGNYTVTPSKVNYTFNPGSATLNN